MFSKRAAADGAGGGRLQQFDNPAIRDPLHFGTMRAFGLLVINYGRVNFGTDPQEALSVY